MGTKNYDVLNDPAVLAAAVVAMSSRCNGAVTEDEVGFNKADSGFGRSLAARPVEWWSPQQVYSAHRMLAKYRNTQLPELGFDWESIPTPPKPQDPAWDTRRVAQEQSRANAAAQAVAERRAVSAGGGRVRVSFKLKDPEFNQLLTEVKSAPGRRWDADTKSWLVPMSPAAATVLLPLLRDRDFSLDAAVQEWSDQVLDATTEAIRLSRAAETDEALTTELPPGVAPYPFQRAGVAYAKRAKRVLIADEQGLGKTVQGILTVSELGAFPCLVVCPNSLKLNWAREFAKWLPGRKVGVFGTKRLARDCDVYVVNYDAVWRDSFEQFVGGEPCVCESCPQAGHADKVPPIRFESIVCDEAQFLKNRKARRTEAVKSIASDLDVRVLLTGTPVLNRPAELISLLDVLGRLDDVGGFKQLFFHHAAAFNNGYGYEFGEPQDLGGLNAKLRACCYVRREKSQVLTELPEKSRTEVVLPLSDRRAYDAAEADLLGYLASAEGADAASAAARAEQLVRVTTLKKLAAHAKMEAVREWVETFLESGEKLVLFAHHVDVQEGLLAAFPGAARILGGDSPEERQAAIDRFQGDPECRLIVCSAKAAGFGVTLTAASNLAFVEFGWNPGEMAQCEDRIHRIGQRRAVTIWNLVGEGTIDSDVLALIAEKARVVDAATSGEVEADAAMVGTLLDRVGKRASSRKGAKK